MIVRDAKDWLKLMRGTFNGTDKRVEAIDMAIKAFEEIQAYRAIGTIDEFKALKEKNEPKKIVKYENDYKCPICGHWIGFRYSHCDGCGQKLDWQ